MAKRIELRRERRVTSYNAAFHRPAWAPDGRLAVELAGRAPAIFVLDAKGRLEGCIGGGSHAAWSPDGLRVVFTRAGEDGRRELWIADAGAPESAWRLAGGDGALWEHPTWSPDGQQIACASDSGSPGGVRHLWLLDAVGGERRRVTFDPQRSDGHPAFSPAGDAIAFDADDRADGAHAVDVHVLDLGTGAITCVTDGTMDTRRPVFIDGRHLLAERGAIDAPELVLVDRRKKRMRVLGDGARGAREPAVRVDAAGRRGRGRVLLACVRRDERREHDAVWVAEVRGLKLATAPEGKAPEEVREEPPAAESAHADADHDHAAAGGEPAPDVEKVVAVEEPAAAGDDLAAAEEPAAAEPAAAGDDLAVVEEPAAAGDDLAADAAAAAADTDAADAEGR